MSRTLSFALATSLAVHGAAVATLSRWNGDAAGIVVRVPTAAFVPELVLRPEPAPPGVSSAEIVGVGSTEPVSPAPQTGATEPTLSPTTQTQPATPPVPRSVEVVAPIASFVPVLAPIAPEPPRQAWVSARLPSPANLQPLAPIATSMATSEGATGSAIADTGGVSLASRGHGRSAAYRRNPAPKYPADALAHGWEGIVLLSVEVGPDGQATALTVKESSGHASLDDAAVVAVRAWEFEPARVDGRPIAARVEVPIRFYLAARRTL